MDPISCRYDFDGVTQATPGCRRAVKVAVSALANLGYEVVAFRPPDLKRAFDMGIEFRAADGGRYVRNMIQDGPVDMHSIGNLYRMLFWPKWKKRLVALALSVKACALQEFL